MFFLCLLVTEVFFNSIYRAEVPNNWKKIETKSDFEDLVQPICCYQIEEGLLTIHTFPIRIPPEVQVQRWKKQTPESEVSPFSHGGFGGFRLEAEKMLAYTLQLNPILYHLIAQSDYTIKFLGDVKKHSHEIDAFAESFELIHPIPYEAL